MYNPSVWDFDSSGIALPDGHEQEPSEMDRFHDLCLTFFVDPILLNQQYWRNRYLKLRALVQVELVRT